MSTNPYEAPQEKSEGPAAQPPVVYVPTGLVTVVVLIFAAVLFMVCYSIADTAHHRQAYLSSCENRVQQIALALQLYHDEYRAFPPAYTVDAAGKPLHSWRTLILPHLFLRDGGQLYKQIDLSKPWDDPVNAAALAATPYVYRCPSAYRSDSTGNLTTYLASVGPRAAFHGSQPRTRFDIQDNPSPALMVLEVPIDKAVPWMSPQDADETLILSIGPDSKLAHHHQKVMMAVFADGKVKPLKATLPADKRRAIISINGGELVKLD